MSGGEMSGRKGDAWEGVCEREGREYHWSGVIRDIVGLMMANAVPVCILDIWERGVWLRGVSVTHLTQLSMMIDHEKGGVGVITCGTGHAHLHRHTGVTAGGIGLAIRSCDATTTTTTTTTTTSTTTTRQQQEQQQQPQQQQEQQEEDEDGIR